MPKRNAKKRKSEYERLAMRVEATAVNVDRMGPDIFTMKPEGQVSSSIAIEGTLDRPVLKTLRDAHVTVFERDERAGNPGAAIGGSVRWNVVCSLPHDHFSNPLALILAGKLVKVDMLFEGMRRGTGVLRSIDFRTEPVPGEAEDEES
jgi:hypothetical protein